MLYIVNTGKNDAGVGFRFEDLPAFSVEENIAFDVAEVGIARCIAVAALNSLKSASDLASTYHCLDLGRCSLDASLVRENILPDGDISCMLCALLCNLLERLSPDGLSFGKFIGFLGFLLCPEGFHFLAVSEFRVQLNPVSNAVAVFPWLCNHVAV